jgi:hypothetical protein
MGTAIGRPRAPRRRILANQLDFAPAAPLFGISKSAADRIIDHIGPLLALKRRQRFSASNVLIVDGTLVPTCDHGRGSRALTDLQFLKSVAEGSVRGILPGVRQPP